MNQSDVQSAVLYFEAHVADAKVDRLRTRALVYLDRGCKVKEAAKACGVSTQTMSEGLAQIVTQWREKTSKDVSPLPLFSESNEGVILDLPETA